MHWSDTQRFTSISYTCGYCGNLIASGEGYQAFEGWPNSSQPLCTIVICHHCESPTFFSQYGRQTPGVLFGKAIEHISEQNIRELYDEARSCIGHGSFTAAVLCCRKLLMHIAVHNGAAEGKKFVYYVRHLIDNDLVPKKSQEWIDHIRQFSNEANHEINLVSRKDAEEIMVFVEMLLKLVYEFPGRIAGRQDDLPFKMPEPEKPPAGEVTDDDIPF